MADYLCKTNNNENKNCEISMSGNNNQNIINNYENSLGKKSEIDNNNDNDNDSIDEYKFVEEKLIEKKAIKGLTILENVKHFFPEDINRNDIKIMIYKALENKIINNQLNYIKGKNLTKEQVEFIIDKIMEILNRNDDYEDNYNIEDDILGDLNIKIGFYDANAENVRKIIFNGKNPTDEEVEEALNNLNNGYENTQLLACEILDD